MQDKPAVTIALIVILVIVVAVTILRIRGGTASTDSRTVAQEQQADAQSNQAPPLDDVPPERDPFGHPVLYMQPVQQDKQTGSPDGVLFPSANPLPILPLKIEGMKPSDPQMNPLPPGEASKPVISRPMNEPPALKLQAVVSGDTPLAVIKDGSGKTHFVHEGEQLGDEVFVARIIDGTVAIRYGGSFSILSLERGSEGNEKTK